MTSIEMINLVSPTLDLFVYHLREGLGIETRDNLENYQYVLEKLPQQLPGTLSSTPVTEDREYAQFLDVKNHETGQFKFAGEFEDEKIGGSYNRFALDDTYGLLCQLSVDGKFDIKDLASCLEKLLILAPDDFLLPGKIGQTWMLSGWLESGGRNEVHHLAESAYKSLIDRGWQYQEKGQFLGATVLEFWRASPQRWEKIEPDSHLVMILYPNQKAMTQAAEFYEYWKLLFCYRNKIIWAYTQSREMKEKTLVEFDRMGPSIENIYNLEWSQLQSTLQKNAITLSDFVKTINALEVYQHTLDINLLNYEKYVMLIEKKAGSFFQVSNDFKFLQEFSDIVKGKYQKQLEKDYANLRPCLEVQENLIATIAGMVSISHAQEARQFQKFVTVAGVGFGTATVVACSSSSWMAQVNQAAAIEPSPWTGPESLTPIAIVLSASALAGILGGFFAWLFFIKPNR